jgi:hypothetical protein
MKRPITAILIDPYARTVSEVEHDAADYKQIYTLLSGEPHDVDTFAAVYPDDVPAGDALFVDDNGLLSSDPRRRFFRWKGYGQMLCGRALILGSDFKGDTVAPKTTLEQARAAVEFPPECFVPKDESADKIPTRESLREIVRKLADEAPADEFDALGLRIAMGSTVADLMANFEQARDITEKLGGRHKVMARIDFGGRAYALSLSDWPDEQPDGGIVAEQITNPAPDNGLNAALAPKEGGEA